MPDQLRLSLLGKPYFERNGQPLSGLTSVKGQALLAYLAVTRQPRSRSALAGLLWAEMPDEVARANLRVTLSQLRKVTGDVLIVTRDAVEFDRHSPTWLDVAVLERAASSGVELPAAASLYRGDFLEDFHVPDALPFEEWLLVERERYRQLGLSVFGRVAEVALEEGRYVEGIAAARRLLSLEPWSESGHQQLMKLLAASGQRNAALAQFETCRRLLADELGVDPSPETKRLVERIRAGERGEPSPGRDEKTAGVAPVAGAHLPPHNLPAAVTSFVGRQVERAYLADLLAQPDCRLITITGLGGSGKTRLALVTASDQLRPDTSFRDGIYFVPLASASQPIDSSRAGLSPVVLAIGITLGLSFAGSSSPHTQLLNSLRDKTMLLVLDNFEHLIDSTGLIVEMLEVAPGLKLIVTSRQSLNLFCEWLFDLQGLPYPATDTATALETFDSVSLFGQRARQVSPNFDLAAELPHVAHICRLVAGLPLGLELAATWVRTLSCRAIVQAVERNLNFLTTTSHHVPARHRSLRAVFDHSWAMLSKQEQVVLCKLSIFRGGFLREAAATVAEASLPMLAQFVDKSLLRRTATGRYDMHELLRQYAAEKLWMMEADLADHPMGLSPEIAPLAWQGHSSYYLNFISQQEAALRGPVPQQVIAEIRMELDNIRQAWQWAVTEGRVDEVEAATGALSRFYDLAGLFQEGESRFAQAAHYLAEHFTRGDQGPDKRVQQVMVRLWVEQVCHLNRRGLAEQALQIISQAADLACQTQNSKLEAISYHHWGETLYFRGESQASQAQLEKALPLARAAGLLDIEAETLRYLGIARKLQGDYAEAANLYHQSLACFQELGDRRGQSLVLNNLGILARRQGHYAQAQTCYEQALNGFYELGDLWGQDVVLNNLGNLMYDQGNYSEAQTLCQRGLQICREIKDAGGESYMLDSLGNIMREQGDFAEAQSYYEQCLQLRREVGVQLDQGATLAELALLFHLIGDHKAAQAYGLEAERIGQKVGSPTIRSQALTYVGHARVALGFLEEAAVTYQQAITLRREMGERQRALESVAGLTRVYLAQGNLSQAQACVEEIVPHLETDVLYGTAETFRIFLTCYQVLQASQDARARAVLELAHRLLQERAAKIEDEEHRRLFLENIAAHQEIEQTFRALQETVSK